MPFKRATQLTAKMVTSPDDPDLADFFQLYDDLFPADEKTSLADIRRWIQESADESRQAEPTYQEVLLLVKDAQEVVAFLNFTYYAADRMLFISYMAIHPTYRADDQVKERLFRSLTEYAQRMDFRFIVFEAENSANGQIPSRIRLYKQFAGMLHFACYEMRFDYVQPLLLPEQLGTDAAEVHMALGCIPNPQFVVNEDALPRTTVLDILHFAYGNVYGDSFASQEDVHRQYTAYMQQLLQHYADTLPELVPVR